MVRVNSGREQRIAQQISSLLGRIFPDALAETLVPMEKSIEMVRGEKVEVQRVFFPGYIYLKVVLDDGIQRAVCGLAGVHSFLSSDGPLRVPEAEIGRIRRRMEASDKSPKMAVSYMVGDQVRVREGPFASMSGSIEEVDMEAERVRVSVPIFGRSTPVELETSAIEKVSS